MTDQQLAEMKVKCRKASLADINELECVECGEPFDLREGYETTGYCDLCAQSIVALEVPQMITEIERLRKDLDALYNVACRGYVGNLEEDLKAWKAE